MDPRASRSQALGVILRLWNLGPIAAEDAEDQKEARALFQAASRQCEMELCEIKNDLELLRKLQLPSVLECRLPEDLNPRYLAVSRVGRESVSAKRGVEEEEILAPIADLKAHWSGVAYLLWKNTLRLEDRIPLRLTQDSVLRLKTALKELGFHDIPMSPVYDRGTVAAVRQIQRRYGLEADGVVGPLTKIVLHQAIGSLKPRDASAHSGTEGLLGEPREDERVSRQ
jgi:general secretion pathway protein A